MNTTSQPALARIRAHYRLFGFWDTLRQVAVHALTPSRDDRFDRDHGTDTGQVLALRYDEPPEPGAVVQSLPTHPAVMRDILEHLGIDPREFVFIDYGCGKGRALLCASEFPFQRIVGVEWADALCAAARRNVQTYRSATQKCRTIEVVCGSVLDYAFPPAHVVLYLYNPFGAVLLRQVFDHIHRQACAGSHRCLVVFSGLGSLEEATVLECFTRAGIEVVATHRLLRPRDSWILGEARRH